MKFSSAALAIIVSTALAASGASATREENKGGRRLGAKKSGKEDKEDKSCGCDGSLTYYKFVPSCEIDGFYRSCSSHSSHSSDLQTTWTNALEHGARLLGSQQSCILSPVADQAELNEVVASIPLLPTLSAGGIWVGVTKSVTDMPSDSDDAVDLTNWRNIDGSDVAEDADLWDHNGPTSDPEDPQNRGLLWIESKTLRASSGILAAADTDESAVFVDEDAVFVDVVNNPSSADTGVDTLVVGAVYKCCYDACVPDGPISSPGPIPYYPGYSSGYGY